MNSHRSIELQEVQECDATKAEGLFMPAKRK
jgi:hypothetical protein